MVGISPMAAIPTATGGLLSATQRFEASAQRTARNGGGESMITDTVEMISAKTDFSANLKVIDTANQMTRTLLDIKV